MFKNKWLKSDRASKAQQLQLLEQQQQPPVPKQDYFESNCHRTYSCIHCRAHLANHDELISKLFQGNHGRAYLFNKVVNIGCKQAVERELLTGLHAVADIYCDSCETTLGWKYEQAFVPSQKYKEGKYIIELVHMLKENNWDLTSHNTRELLLEHSDKFFRRKQNNRWLHLPVVDECTPLDEGSTLDESSSIGNSSQVRQANVIKLVTKNCAVQSTIDESHSVNDDEAAITLAKDSKTTTSSPSIPSSSSSSYSPSSSPARINDALGSQHGSGHNQTISLQNGPDESQDITIDMPQDEDHISEFPNELPSLD